MNGLLIFEIIFTISLALFIMVLLCSKKLKKGVKKHFKNFLLCTSCLCALVTVTSGIYLYDTVTNTADVTMTELVSAEVDSLMQKNKISFKEYSDFRNGNCKVYSVCNNEFCWFTTVNQIKVVYNF